MYPIYGFFDATHLAGLFGEIESELSGGKSAKVPEVGDPSPGEGRAGFTSA